MEEMSRAPGWWALPSMVGRSGEDILCYFFLLLFSGLALDSTAPAHGCRGQEAGGSSDSLLPMHFHLFGASLQTLLSTPLFTGEDIEARREGEGPGQQQAELEPEPRGEEGV